MSFLFLPLFTNYVKVEFSEVDIQDAAYPAPMRAEMAVLEAQDCRDWLGYEEALREMCRVARQEAIKAECAKAGAA
jgi:hypothetical protein